MTLAYVALACLNKLESACGVLVMQLQKCATLIMWLLKCAVVFMWLRKCGMDDIEQAERLIFHTKYYIPLCIRIKENSYSRGKIQ